MDRKQTQIEPFPDVVEIDEIDKIILKELQNDGKSSLRHIAKLSNHSISTVKAHIDLLVKKGVIEDFIAIVNCCRLGYCEMTHLHIRVFPTADFQLVLDKLVIIPTINLVHRISGEYQIFCLAKCIGKKEQIALLEQVNKIEGIEKIQVEVVLQRIKEDMRIEIPR